MFINIRNDRKRLGCSLFADARTSVPTVRGLIIACVTYYSLVLACEAGTRRGHYSGYSLLDRRMRTLERASLQVGCGLLQSRGRPIVPVGSGRGAGSVPVYMHTPNAIKSHSSRDVRSCVRTKPSSVVVAVPCAGLAPVRKLSSPARRDARSSVHTKPSPVVVDIRCLSSIGINIYGDYFNITIIFCIFAYNKV